MSDWLRRFTGGFDPEVRLVCLPSAGGSAAQYGPWAGGLAPRVETLAVELPGHGVRLGETPVLTIPGLVEPVAAALAALPPLPTVLFGHSMGGTVAWEVCRSLRRRGRPLPERLVVAASEAPSAAPIPGPEQDLSDEGLIDFLERCGGMPAGYRDDLLFLELYLPVLRSDLTAGIGHRPVAEPPLDCPITVYLGADDPSVGRSEVAGWNAETSGPVTTHVFPGGHFFLFDEAAGVERRLSADLLPAPYC